MIDVSMSHLDGWCQRWLGSGVGEVLFTTGHLSHVVGVRLDDGRSAVVKVRPHEERLLGCLDTQSALWKRGFPCPQPLAGPARLDEWLASAEAYVPDGEILAPTGDAVSRYATLLARLLRLAPSPHEIRSLRPNPPWTDWDHDQAGVWPMADDQEIDLNGRAEPAWLDEVGWRVRARPKQSRDETLVVGHGDWEAQNLRWLGADPLAVHDWDSVIVAPEPVVVGLAASVWPCGAEPRAATIDESQAFIEAYQRAAGPWWSKDQVQTAWAAGLWVYAFNTKKASLHGIAWLGEQEAEERLRRAGAT